MLFLLYINDLLTILENSLLGCTDNSSLLTQVFKPSNKVSAVLSVNRDLARIDDWCKRWEMLVNHINIKALVNSRSRTLAPVFPNLLLDSIVVERVT